MDKGKQLVDEGFQRKRKWTVSVESDDSIPWEGLIVDARCADCEEKFFRINPGVDRRVGLQMLQIIVHNSLFIFVFLFNG